MAFPHAFPGEPDRFARELTAVRRRSLLGLAACGLGLTAAAQSTTRADDNDQVSQALEAVRRLLEDRWTDIQSVAVVRSGQTVFEFYRDANPDRLRNVQSVEKSALAALVGVALSQQRIQSLDQPVIDLMPEWRGVNADARTNGITLRHLVTMTAGFEVGRSTPTSGKMPPSRAWARRLAAEPGARFAYDNAHVGLIGAVMERATGMSLPEFAREQLVLPLGLAEPAYKEVVYLRTLDMARLGQLFLQEGRWGGRYVVPPQFAAEATSRQNAGGPPLSMAYGYLWWVIPDAVSRPTFLASGWSGQVIWVHPPTQWVVAATSSIAPEVHERGQVIQLLRDGLLPAASGRT